MCYKLNWHIEEICLWTGWVPRQIQTVDLSSALTNSSGEMMPLCFNGQKRDKCDNYLTEVVVDVKASVRPQQQLHQFVEDGQLPLHHSYMKSSVINTNTHRHIKKIPTN